MASNDVVLISGMLTRDRDRLAPGMAEADHATYFTASKYLFAYNLSNEEISEGIVDGEHDCGLDGIYVFANGMHLRDDTPVAGLGRNARLDLVLMQVKTTAGFGEQAVDKLIVNLPRLLVFDRDESQLSGFTNPKLIEVTRRFLSAYQSLDMPELRIYVAFASIKADSVHPNTEAKAEVLKSKLQELFGGASVDIHFLDARALCDLSRQTPDQVRKLVLAENPISTDRAGGYVALVRLADYEDFITGAGGELDVSLFEANVRDYEGETAVNDSIQDTLANEEADVDFWWLNNGVTIVANRVQPANKLLELEAPQIVNGLQTSTEIYKRRRSESTGIDTRALLVKIIQAQDPATRDRIIRATNSQTAFGPSALKATDMVQRQIEDYLLGFEIYYERRRRQYHNQQKPLDQIVSIDLMGQAVLSALVQAPHISRGSVTRVFENDTYQLLFNPNHPLAMYRASITLLHKCRDYLTGFEGLKPYAEDFQFHLCTILAIWLTRKDSPSAKDIAQLEDVSIEDRDLSALLGVLQQQYRTATRLRGLVTFDQIAKSEEVTKEVVAAGRRHMRATRKPDVERG